MDDFTIDFLLRFAGRTGFILLIIALYRLYLLFSSPLTRIRHKKPLAVVVTSLVVSFILLIINYIIPDDWMSRLVMVFNVVTTFIFGIYLYHQGTVLQEIKSTSEYYRYKQSLDSLILRMKH